VTPEAVLQELDGLRALACSLVRGDADDLLQDTAVTLLEQPPATASSCRSWEPP
jgi:DNA-directed RNA polymerase specialized sigma24 family protein